MGERIELVGCEKGQWQHLVRVPVRERCESVVCEKGERCERVGCENGEHCEFFGCEKGERCERVASRVNAASLSVARKASGNT